MKSCQSNIRVRPITIARLESTLVVIYVCTQLR